jgi:hypothetical protein
MLVVEEEQIIHLELHQGQVDLVAVVMGLMDQLHQQMEVQIQVAVPVVVAHNQVQQVDQVLQFLKCQM